MAMDSYTTQDELFLLMYIAHPAPGSDDFGRMGGAFVVCLLDIEDKTEAHRRAIERIEARGWRAHSLEAAERVTREDVDIERRPYFDQALVEKEVVLFYSWAIDAADSESPAPAHES